MNFRSTIGIVLCAILFLQAGACRKPVGAPSKKGFIAVVGAGREDELWQVLGASAQRAGREVGVGVAVRTLAPDSVSAAKQIALIESLRGSNLRALCVQVTAPEILLPLLEDLRTSGVFVVTMVRPVPSKIPFHHCGLDESEVGKAIATALVEGIQGRGTVAVLRCDGADARIEDRARGFRDVIGRSGGIDILRELDCGGDPARARELIRAFCERFPRVGGLAVLEDWPFPGPGGMTEPIVPAGCKLVGADPLPSTWTALSKGWCHALIGAEYGEIAYRAVQWAMLVTDRRDVPVQTYRVPLRKVWSGNIEDFQARWQAWASIPATAGESAR